MAEGVRQSSDPEMTGEPAPNTPAAPDINPAESMTGSKAVAQLYENHAEALSSYLRKAFGDGPPDPDDIAQEAFQRLLEHKSLSSIQNLQAFLWRTARNLTVSKKRSIERRSKFDFEIEHLFFGLEGPGLSPERVLEVKEQLRIVRRVLEKMPDRRRRAFLWHRVEGLSFTAIGKRLGITRRAVARHVVKAACDLETALEDATEHSE